MDTPLVVWLVTGAAIAALLAFDFWFHVRTPHVPTIREAAVWSALYVGIAIAFGVGYWLLAGREPGTEYFAGYLTEKALSVDNLFVFLVIIASFRVPREHQQKVLLFGIAFAIAARTVFILLGSAFIEHVSWAFYLFGLILVVTAGRMLRKEGEDAHEDDVDNVMIRLARRYLRTSPEYDRDRFTTVVDGRRMLTPMVLVMVAIGGTDILFALDSIPAIFGLTRDPYIVFTATAFSLLGLRQLFFLIEGLLDRLVYLAYGLSLILAFIGVKLMLHALHENSLPFINEGEPVPVIEVDTTASLLAIAVILLVTVVASLRSQEGRAQAAIQGARRHARQYLDLGYTFDPTERLRVFGRLLEEEAALKALAPKYRERIRREEELMALIREAHEEHDRSVIRRARELQERAARPQD